MEGSGRGLQMGGAAAPGRVWAAAPGSRLLLPGPRDQDQGQQPGGPRGGRGAEPGRWHNFPALKARGRYSATFTEAALCQTPHAGTETISKPAAPRASLSSQYHLPLPKSKSHPPTKTGFRGLAFEKQVCPPCRLPIPGVDPGLETCLLWVPDLPGAIIFPLLFHKNLCAVTSGCEEDSLRWHHTWSRGLLHEDESTASSHPFSRVLVSSGCKTRRQELRQETAMASGSGNWLSAGWVLGSPFPGLADGRLLPAPSLGLFSAGISQVSLCVSFPVL